jgi:hypothetical protein
MLGKDDNERQGIPICSKGEWYTIDSSVMCPKCSDSLMAIGQGTEMWYCHDCEELSQIEVNITHKADHVEIKFGEQAIIKDVVIDW